MTMRSKRASSVLRYIRRIVAAECAVDLPDRELLERFANRRDEAAYTALVRRHGPMVLRLCVRVLQNEQDAEDAFQATFLVLIRRAASLRPQESVAGWLYSVAYRIAQKLRIDAARRRKYEGRAARAPVVDSLGQITLREAHEVLDQELARLPDKLRVPLVLCYLEGLTRDEAAHQLGLPPSTLKSRLEQARERLRMRLASRGLAFAGALVASIFSERTVSAVLPAVLLDSTVETAIMVAAGGTTASVVPAHIAALAEGVAKAMFMTKLKIATTAVLFALVGLGTVVGVAHVTAAGPRPKKAPVTQLVAAAAETPAPATDGGLQQQVQDWTWYVAKVDEAQNVISLQTQPYVGAVAFMDAGGEVKKQNLVPAAQGGGGEGGLKVILPPPALPANVRVVAKQFGILLHVGVAEGAQVVIDGQAGQLADLKRGMQVTVQMAKDRPIITRIDAITPGKVSLTGIDVEKRVIRVSLGGQEWTAPVAADATIGVVGNPQAQLSDLNAGMSVSLTLGVDAGKIVVKTILANNE